MMLKVIKYKSLWDRDNEIESKNNKLFKKSFGRIWCLQWKFTK